MNASQQTPENEFSTAEADGLAKVTDYLTGSVEITLDVREQVLADHQANPVFEGHVDQQLDSKNLVVNYDTQPLPTITHTENGVPVVPEIIASNTFGNER